MRGDPTRTHRRGRRDLALEPTGPVEVRTTTAGVTELAAALARSEGRQRDFLLSVSHDPRTPLTTIAGYAELLREPGALSADAVPDVGGVLVDETARLPRMVGDLLTLARLEADEVTFTPEAVAVAPLLERTAEAPIVLAAVHGETPGTWAIEVRDGGPGLSDDDLRVAFDRSALTDRYAWARATGAGPGLAIVHRLDSGRAWTRPSPGGCGG